MVPSTQSQGHYFIWVMKDLGVATTSLPAGRPSTPYSATLEVSNAEVGWPLGWDITQGTLPLGLTLSENGVIAGTPTGPDTKTFTVRVREPFRRFGERQLTLVIAAQLTASAPALGAGEVGLRYGRALRTSGGTQPFKWVVESGELPAGLSLNPTTGAIRGVPTSAGISPVRFAVTDAGGQKATVSATIRIVPRLAIGTTRLPAAIAGKSYRASLTTTGGLAPKRWTIARGRLPSGIRLNPATGGLSGVPRKAGTYRITVRATDRLGASSTRTLPIIVG
jgi:hypothetical protein